MSFFLVGIFSVLFMNGRRDIKNLSFYGILIFIGTSNVFIKVLKNIPFSEFLIFSKVTSIAIALILVSILLWRNLRKVLIVIICFILLSDSMLTFDLIGHNREFPEGLVYSLDYASEIATQRIGILDLSQYGALPSYYLKYGVKGKSSNQVFGWQWKSANTSENIVMINTALENNYYLVMFDRCIQLGADTLLIKKDLINDFNYLDECANPNGYIKVYEDTNDIIYKYPIEGTFGTTVKFDGIAIGKYAPATVILLPFMGICFGSSINIIVALKSGVSGIVLTALFYLVCLFPLLILDRKLGKRPGYAAIAMSSVAGLSISVPSLATEMSKVYVPFMDVAMSQIALASIITSVITPMIIKYIIKK